MFGDEIDLLVSTWCLVTWSFGDEIDFLVSTWCLVTWSFGDEIDFLLSTDLRTCQRRMQRLVGGSAQHGLDLVVNVGKLFCKTRELS